MGNIYGAKTTKNKLIDIYIFGEKCQYFFADAYFGEYLSPTFESIISNFNVIPLIKSCRASVRTFLGQFFMSFRMVLVFLMIVMFFLSPGNKTGSGLESHWKSQKCQNFTKFQFASKNCYRCCAQPSSVAKLHVWCCQGGVFIDFYCFLKAKHLIFGSIGAHF